MRKQRRVTQRGGWRRILPIACWIASSLYPLHARDAPARDASEVASQPGERSAEDASPEGGKHRSVPPQESLRRRREQLLQELAPRGFTVAEQSPFLVVGDEPAERVRRRATGTVRWALGHLERDYFESPPKRPVELWVLRDEASYLRVARGRFGVRAATPFGFYAPTKAAIVVNGATGPGTIVHEMVHALLAADFPDCPAWFNEGFASLFEQCEEREGTIWGLPNWRLRGLQRALDRRELPRLEHLCGLDEQAFYGEGDSLRYAQARYLCLYLQDRGVLRGFYARFRESHDEDPGGYATLRTVLGGIQPVELERDWAAYVAALVAPGE